MAYADCPNAAAAGVGITIRTREVVARYANSIYAGFSLWAICRRSTWVWVLGVGRKAVVAIASTTQGRVAI